MEISPKLERQGDGAARGRTMLLGCLIAVGAWLAVGAASAMARTVYVPNSNSGNTTPIDTGTNTAGPSFPTADIPQAVAVTPDGVTAYVLIAGNGFDTSPGLIPVATATNTPGTTIPINIPPIPQALAISPDGDTAYVGGNDNMGAGQVIPVDLGTGSQGASIPAGAGIVTGIAIAPDGDTAYAVSADGTVIPIDLTTTPNPTPGTPIPVGTIPAGIAITPDGATAYVANLGTDNVTPIDTGTNTAGTAIAVGDGPKGVAITPDGTTAYVTNQNSDNVTPIDLPSTPGAPITVGDTPNAIAITPDGESAYVSNRESDDVTRIVTADNTAAVPTIGVGDFPVGVAIVPDQGPVAAFSSTPAPAGQASGFDGSASSDPDGSVARFDWDFGDGTLLADGGAAPSHVYAAPGDYTASLVVTDDEGCSTEFVFTGQTASCNGSSLAETSEQLSVPAPPGVPADPAPGTAAKKPFSLTLKRKGKTDPRRSCFVVTATADGQPLSGVVVKLKHKTKRTRANGRARICIRRQADVRRMRIKATKPGFQPATRKVKIPQRQG